ncbi:hypothetical protein VTI28DRAFT_9372 [Corynascus sepedonium]
MWSLSGGGAGLELHTCRIGVVFGLIVHELARLERQSARPAIGRRHAKIGSAIGELVEDSECFSTSVEDVREHEGIRMRCASEDMNPESRGFPISDPVTADSRPVTFREPRPRGVGGSGPAAAEGAGYRREDRNNMLPLSKKQTTRKTRTANLQTASSRRDALTF